MGADRPDSAPPPNPGRRKALIALGYAAGSVIALGRLGSSVFRSSGSHPHSAHSFRGPQQPHPGAPVDPPAIQGAAPQPPPDHVYDVVLAGGRVLDPETGFDRHAEVGIDGGTITAISLTPLQAKNRIDVHGDVVAPGFIDVLSYEPDDEGAWFKLGDGVTTNLGMHGMQSGVWAADFYSRYTNRCPVNFGGAFSDHWVRYHKLGLNAGQTANASQIATLAGVFEQELHNGWLGICFEPEYTPGVNYDEIKALAQVAQRYGVPCFFHGRFSAYDQEKLTVPEIIRCAKDTGAAVHVAHLPSTGGTWCYQQALEQIHQARDQGHDVTACMYPYNYWATYLGSARFSDGWQQRYRISYHDLQIAGTPERVTAATFGRYQQQNKLAVAYAIPDASVVAAFKDPVTMIGSDAILSTGNNHPRATGCFARAIGRLARDRNLLPLREVLSKMTIQPAKRLEAKGPALRRKGRLQRGADADITVFDPAKVIDTSTVEQPAQFSAGIDWVLLGGQLAKTPQGVQQGLRAGQPVRSVV